MLRKGLGQSTPGADARERITSFGAAGEALLLKVHQVWPGIRAAAEELPQEVGAPLHDAL